MMLLAAAVAILSYKVRSTFKWQRGGGSGSSGTGGVAAEDEREGVAGTVGDAGLSIRYAHTLQILDRILNKPTLLLRAQRFLESSSLFPPPSFPIPSPPHLPPLPPFSPTPPSQSCCPPSTCHLCHSCLSSSPLPASPPRSSPFPLASGRPIPPPALHSKAEAAWTCSTLTSLLLSYSSLSPLPPVTPSSPPFHAPRDDLYRHLPSTVKHKVRRRLSNRSRPFDVEVAAEMRRSTEQMLAWVLPMAQRTLAWQAEHSYGCHLSKRQRSLHIQPELLHFPLPHPLPSPVSSPLPLPQTLHYVDRECFELLLVEMLVSLSYFCRPAGLTNIKPDEEAAWKMWQSSGGLIQPSFVNPHRGVAGTGGAGDGRDEATAAAAAAAAAPAADAAGAAGPSSGVAAAGSAAGSASDSPVAAPSAGQEPVSSDASANASDQAATPSAASLSPAPSASTEYCTESESQPLCQPEPTPAAPSAAAAPAVPTPAAASATPAAAAEKSVCDSATATPPRPIPPAFRSSSSSSTTTTSSSSSIHSNIPVPPIPPFSNPPSDSTSPATTLSRANGEACGEEGGVCGGGVCVSSGAAKSVCARHQASLVPGQIASCVGGS
ncbi:unnamed protein product [Closterium sp. NIES-54]